VVPEIHKCPEFQYWKGLQALFPRFRMSETGNPDFPRDSARSYRSCGNDNGTGEVRDSYRHRHPYLARKGA